MQLNFSLQRWCAWHSEIPVATQPWPNGELLPHVNGSADVQFLPMLQRRRLSPLGRVVAAVAQRCQQDFGPMPSVFYSRHGESRYSFEILEALADQTPISPNQFSLCVHNAIAGQAHMHSENTQPYVVLAGGTEGLFAGFIEAAGLLQQAPEVLLVCYDQPLPALYQPFVAHADSTWALGMLLGRVEAEGLALQLQRELALESALSVDETDLLKTMCAGECQGQLNYPQVRWQWCLGG